MEGSLIRILFFLLPTLASADPANNEWNSTTRSLSMGNLGIASAEDSTTAMFYNPAALARTKKFTAEFMNPQFDIGSGLFTLGRGITDAPKHTSLGTVRPLVEARSTKASYLGFSLYPNLSAQNFNFGILAKGEGLSYHDGTKLNYRSKYQYPLSEFPWGHYRGASASAQQHGLFKLRKTIALLWEPLRVTVPVALRLAILVMPKRGSELAWTREL